MPLWSSGVSYNSGALWGPSSPAAPTSQNSKRKRPNMKRQHYYPRLHSARPEWHQHFADRLPDYAAALTLETGDVNQAVADNEVLAYGLGLWLTNVRDFAPACTAAQSEFMLSHIACPSGAFEAQAFEARSGRP